MKHVKLISLVAVGQLAFLALFPIVGLGKSTVIDSKKSADAVIGQWMAAGSGCQASADKPGDVQLVSVETDPTNPMVHTVTFSLPQYRLKPLAVAPERPKVSLINYARECAIRLNVNPPKGYALSGVTGSTEFEVSKDNNAKLLAQATLKVGATTITKDVKQFTKEESFKFRTMPIELIPGRTPEDETPQIECEAKKIVGIDFTFLTNKDSETALAEARIAGNGLARFKISFDKCPQAQK